MRKSRLWWIIGVLAFASHPGCNCSDNGAAQMNDFAGIDASGAGDDLSAGGGNDLSVSGGQDLSAAVGDLAGQPDLFGVFGNICTPPASIALTPANQTSTVTPGTAFTQSYTATASYVGGGTANVTPASFFTISDPTVGSFAGNVFTWGGNHGGAVTVSAQSCGVVGTTTLTLALSATVGTGGGMFGGPPSTMTSCDPQLVYPPDGVLIPPNTNVIEVHFTTPTGNNLYEISFTNAITTVKVYTSCTGTTAAQGMPLNGGCVFELNQNEWDYIAKTNRGGSPITVMVRAVGCDSTGAVASSTTRQISFAQEDLVGTLYYWSSIDVGGTNPFSGGVFSYDFGVRGQSATPVLTPTNLTKINPGFCIGCHTISRDGRKMVFDYDDNDGDDEYGDVATDIFDIAAQTITTTPPLSKGAAFPPGYHTWNRTTGSFLLSDGPGNKATPAGAFMRYSAAGAPLGVSQTVAQRGTSPDWAPDDSSVVYSVPATGAGTMNFMQSGSDLWFAAASLFVAPWDPVNNKLGTPTQILASNGTSPSSSNYYYPSYSPDGSLLAFNYVPSGPNFHNPQARVQLVPSGAAAPTALDLTKLNDTGALTNSWPRWSPFVQTYQGQKLLWMTFSSTRDYGLRVQNSGKQNCYPNASPTVTCPAGAPCPYGRKFTTAQTPACTHTQIWMAAVKLDAAAVGNGTDVSWPAFWLPFQDMTHNNHLAQWAQQGFSGTCSMDADCNPVTDGGATSGRCCYSGACASCVVPPPPPASCASDANCATGQCCQSGSCAACPQDGGIASPDMSTSGCNTCLNCPGQSCVNNMCGSCTTASDCCAPNVCQSGMCVPPIN